MIVALAADGPGAAAPAPPVAARAGRGARRAALRARARPELAVPLALMALVGTLGFNFQVMLPLLAAFSFDGGAARLRGAGLRRWGSASVAGALRHRRARPHRAGA